MDNLSTLVSKPDVIKALERIIKEKLELIKVTKFNLITTTTELNCDKN